MQIRKGRLACAWRGAYTTRCVCCVTLCLRVPCLLQVIADHNLTQLTCWPGGDACVEEVQGTDGNQFRPGLKLHDRLTLWMGALFRSAELVTLGPQMFNGIRLLRFQPVGLSAGPVCACVCVCAALLVCRSFQAQAGIACKLAELLGRRRLAVLEGSDLSALSVHLVRTRLPNRSRACPAWCLESVLDRAKFKCTVQRKQSSGKAKGRKRADQKRPTSESLGPSTGTLSLSQSHTSAQHC